MSFWQRLKLAIRAFRYPQFTKWALENAEREHQAKFRVLAG